MEARRMLFGKRKTCVTESELQIIGENGGPAVTVVERHGCQTFRQQQV